MGGSESLRGALGWGGGEGGLLEITYGEDVGHAEDADDDT